MQQSLGDGGSIMAWDFTNHIAQQAEAEARILKQTRLLREELEAKRKDDQPKKGPKKGGGGSGDAEGTK